MGAIKGCTGRLNNRCDARGSRGAAERTGGGIIRSRSTAVERLMFGQWDDAEDADHGLAGLGALGERGWKESAE